MIDLHNHILPGLDDGASTWEDSLSMARLAIEDGINSVVCTPHWIPGLYENTRSSVLPALGLFQERLEERGIPLTVYPGSELRLDFHLARRIESGELLTINDTGRFALIELTDGALPQNLENFFWDLQVQNITPIIGHPERNVALRHNPTILHKLVEKGALTQITAAGLTGRFGTAVENFCIFLLEHQMVHCIATDAHGLRLRTPLLSEAVRDAERILGEEAARRLVHENPANIVSGKPFTVPAPLPLKSPSPRFPSLRKFFAFFDRKDR